MKFYVRVLILLAAAIAVPCITVFSATNYVALNQYKEAVSNSQVDKLQAVGGANALIVDSLEQSALRLSLEPSIQALGNFEYMDFNPSSDNYLDYLSFLIRTQRMLADFLTTTELLDSVYLYVDGANYIISTRDGVVELTRFTDQSWIDKYQELRENLNAHRMLPAHHLSGKYNTDADQDDYSRQCLTYVYPITPYTSTFNGAIIFNIDEERLLEMYLGDSSTKGFAMFTDDGKWLTGLKESENPDLINEFVNQNVFSPNGFDKGYFFSENGRGRLQCTYYRSDDRRYVLLDIEDMSVMMDKVAYLQIIFAVFLVAFIPFVALMVLMISRRLYSPINKLAKELYSSGMMVETSAKTTTINSISRAVKQLLREERRLFSDQSIEKFRVAACLRILAGEEQVDDEDIRTILPFSRNICAVCLVDAPVTQCREDDDFDSRIRILMRVIEEEFKDNGIHPTVIRYDESMIVIIFSIDDTVVSSDSFLQLGFSVIQREAVAILGDTVSFAVGSLKEDLTGVRQCFEQAKSAIQYRFLTGLESILFYDEIFTGVDYYRADDKLKYIRHCLVEGNKNNALSGISKLVEELKATGGISYTCVSQVLNQLVNMLTEYAIERNIQIEELLDDSTPVYSRLWQNRTLDEACKWLKTLFAAVMDYQNVGDASSSEYIGEIIRYVRENYNRDITIDSIAVHIGISYSYLRKLFKEATGRNLADYIGELRIAKAKTLLQETNYTVKAVAQMCGFNHERTFSRAFTQAEGITPGRYKCAHNELKA